MQCKLPKKVIFPASKKKKEWNGKQLHKLDAGKGQTKHVDKWNAIKYVCKLTHTWVSVWVCECVCVEIKLQAEAEITYQVTKLICVHLTLHMANLPFELNKGNAC